MEDKKETKKFKLSMPETYVIIFAFLIFATLLTYIVPAGEYQMVKEGNTSVVDPNSFAYVDRSPTTFRQFWRALPEGMVKGSQIIFFVLLTGGFFQIINDTGSLDLVIDHFVRKLGDKSYWTLPVVMVMMSILGAFGIVVNVVVAFIPIGLVLARKLKMDGLVAVSSMYLAAFAGFGSTFMAASSVQVAQNIAQLPPLSGLGLRVVVFVVITLVTIVYVMRYGLKVRKDSNNSLLDEKVIENTEDESGREMSWKNVLIVLLLFAGIAFYAVGTVCFSFDLYDMSAIIFLVAIVSAILGGMSPNAISRSFIKGCRGMVYAGFAIGLANAITIVLTNGKIIHTIIRALSMPVANFPAAISAPLLMIVNTIFNFFVPSNSGQAAIVMPLMAPMADILGFSRQVAVLAYQYGAGFGDIIIPTSGVLMASLGSANVPFQKWIKYILPLFFTWVAIGILAIVIGVMIGYS
jgi:uncharacterized ion transporter superfamily protein YfcC